MPWGGPMNGQYARLQIAMHLVTQCQVDQVVETGSHRGGTSVWFAQCGLPFVTIESQRRLAEFTRRRLRPYKNARLVVGDSAEVLRSLATCSKYCEYTTLFYLDAHWEDHLPLADELRIITKNFPQFIALIDDFAVPWDAGYTYDDYGPGKALTVDYLRSQSIDIAHIFFPSVPASAESGAKRGCAILTNSAHLAGHIAKNKFVRALT